MAKLASLRSRYIGAPCLKCGGAEMHYYYCAGEVNEGVLRGLFNSFDSNGDGRIDEGAARSRSLMLRTRVPSCMVACACCSSSFGT